MNIPKKYLPKILSFNDKNIIRNALKKSRKLYKKKVYFTRPKVLSYKSKKSNHLLNVEKIYKIKTLKVNDELSRKTGCSKSSLKKILKKGQGAYYSSGSRPNQSAHSWGYARLASAITGYKSAAVDFNILKDGCKKTGKAYKLALKAKKKFKFGTRRVPKIKF